MFDAKTVRRPLFCLVVVSSLIFSILGVEEVSAAEKVQFCPYWYVDGTTDATLEITNDSDGTRQFTPTLMIGGQQAVNLGPITVEPRGTARLSIREAVQGSQYLHRGIGGNRPPIRWGDGTKHQSLWGSAHLKGLSFAGVHSWILVNDRESGISVNSMFEHAKPYSASLVSLWWHPTTETEELFILQNTGRRKINIQPTFTLNGRLARGRPFQIPPGNAYLANIRDLLPEAPINYRSLESGGVRFDIKGRSSSKEAYYSMQGITMIFDERAGFSSPLHMHRPDTDLSARMQLAGTLKGSANTIIDMGFPDYTHFNPRLLLTNFSAEEIDVGLTMRTATSLVEEELDGELMYSIVGSSAFGLRKIILEPFSNRIINLSDIEGNDETPSGVIGLEVIHSGEGSAVLAEVLAVDETLRYSFYDPLLRVEREPLSLTTVSFNLAQDNNKIVVVKNMSDHAVTAGVFIRYTDADGTSQEYQVSQMLPGQDLFMVDLRKLRDSGQPDVANRILPPNLTSGHVVVAASSPVVIASDLAFNKSGSAASCFDPCECDPICPESAFCIVPPLPPPTLIRQFDQTFDYGLTTATITACNYSVCPGAAPPAACPGGSSFSEPLAGTGCWVSASRSYHIAHWAQNDYFGNLLYTFVTCSQNGNTSYWINPLGPCT